MSEQYDSPQNQPGGQNHPGGVPGPKRLTRRTDDGMLGGVCAGLAEYLGVDVTLIRIAAVIAAVLGFGSVVLVYLLAWVLVPEA